MKMMFEGCVQPVGSLLYFFKSGERISSLVLYVDIVVSLMIFSDCLLYIYSFWTPYNLDTQVCKLVLTSRLYLASSILYDNTTRLVESCIHVAL